MKDITQQFSNRYEPVKALLIYNCTSQSEDEGDGADERQVYVESYDIGLHGKPINAHPLTTKEMLSLSELFATAKELKTDFLNCRGMMPASILHIDHSRQGRVVWYTPAQEADLYFAASLTIPSGKAYVPALIWQADRENLYVYAIKSSRKPMLSTELFHAPFFNIYRDGKVCMGTVKIDIGTNICLEDFTRQWEDYFWNSYFSHLFNGFNPVTENIVQLWQQQVKENHPFPVGVLQSTGKKLQQLITQKNQQP